MSDVTIYIRGGTFQGAVSNSTGDRIMVVDFDDEAACGKKNRSFQPVAKLDLDADERNGETGGAQ